VSREQCFDLVISFLLFSVSAISVWKVNSTWKITCYSYKQISLEFNGQSKT